MSERRTYPLDWMAATVAAVVMLVYFLTMLAPYGLAMLGLKVDPALQQTVKDNKNTVDLITTAVVMFFFGASVRRGREEETQQALVETNQTLAQTAQTAQSALAPLTPEPTVVLEPGDTATVKAENGPQ